MCLLMGLLVMLLIFPRSVMLPPACPRGGGFQRRFVKGSGEVPRRARRDGEILAGSHQKLCCDTSERCGGGFGVWWCCDGGADAACGELAKAVVSSLAARGEAWGGSGAAWWADDGAMEWLYGN